jgi:hypothetical protein
MASKSIPLNARFKPGDRCAYDPHDGRVRRARDYWLGLGDYTRKNTAKVELDRLLAKRGTVTSVDVAPSGNAQTCEILWDDGTRSSGFASDHVPVAWLEQGK